MADIMDFLGPMMPRRGGPPRSLPVPHPASGRAPDLMQILAEAATNKYGEPYNLMYQGGPDTGDAVRNVVNNPTPDNVPVEDLVQAATQLVKNHGITGVFPGLQRTLIDRLAEAHLARLDSEAAWQPSLARMLLQGEPNPSVMDLYDQAGGAPKLSEFFGGMTPTANPAEMQDRINVLMQRMQQHEPTAKYGQEAAILDEIAPELPGGVQPSDMKAVQGGTRTGMEDMAKVLGRLRYLAMAGDSLDNIKIMQLVNHSIRDLTDTEKHRVRAAIMDAVASSGIGTEKRNPLLDPASRRSLAPDINPAALGYNLQADARRAGQEPPDLELLLRLMGMQRTIPGGSP